MYSRSSQTNKEGKFKDELSSDIQGILSMYEAAHFLVHGELILDEALAFTTAHLKSLASDLSPFLVAQVKRALKQTIRKGMPRVEAKHFISIYHQDPSHIEALLCFAKLDFNIVQKLHRKEICDATRWWKDLDFESKLSYAQDRLVKVYMWALGAYFEPKYTICRRIIIKILSMISILDNTYDTHGTLEELQTFTDVVHRWDIICLDNLPNYMKHIYRTQLDTHTKKLRNYFDEAKWFHEKYVPTVEEYIELGIQTSTMCNLTITSFVGMAGDVATEDAFDWVSKFPKIIRAVSIIARLMDDIVGHKFEQERGHYASSIECYVKQYGVTEEEAYTNLRAKIGESWKDVNEECLEPRDVPMPLLMRPVNVARVMDTLYKDEYCYTQSGGIMKDTINSMFIPI